jgi:hypothetical protein
MMTLELKRHDQAEALEALRRGEYEAITTSGQGALDELIHLALELGVAQQLVDQPWLCLCRSTGGE